MWTAIKKESVNNQTLKFNIIQNGKKLSVNDFINGLIDSKEFRLFYNSLLKDISFHAFFWENIPFTSKNLSFDYEFAIVNSDILAKQKADKNTFKEYFKTNDHIVIFSNLSGDAKLIVPCPIQETEKYTHIGNFTRSENTQQVDTLWKEIGKEISKNIGDNPIWLSTAGLGVSWLHVRIDSKPKYYRTYEYKHLN